MPLPSNTSFPDATLTSSRRNRDAKLRPAPFSALQDQRKPACLEAAILELSNWVEQRGAADVADNVRGALEAIDKNEEFIKLTLAVLMTPE